jgi:hypothetical protein
MLQVLTIILYQNVFLNPELKVSLSPEQSTLALHARGIKKIIILDQHHAKSDLRSLI